MCGALSEKLEPASELDFAAGLLNEVVRGLPKGRLGLHVCRGNWTPDESAALSGDYAPLLDTLSRADVGVLFLELSTPRAGEAAVLKALPDDKRIAVGVVNQKLDAVEPSGTSAPQHRPSGGPLWRGARPPHAGLRLRHLRRQPRILSPHCGGQAPRHRPRARPAAGLGKGRQPLRHALGVGLPLA